MGRSEEEMGAKPMKAASPAFALLIATALGGCSGSSGLSTSSLLGGDDKPAAPVNDAPARAFQVGTVSARAVKCGFHFDPGKLKVTYLDYERNIPGQDMAKIERVYDVSYNGVAKAVAGEGEYCTDGKTRQIKADLSRHLVGDYTPRPQVKEKEDDGLFSFGNYEGEGMKTKFPMDNRDD
ncbi:hypothetical protein [Hyphomicrobium sulfonivorans]|nr:hypothetical protein [Hyphomicrobium sulfonivorans]